MFKQILIKNLFQMLKKIQFNQNVYLKKLHFRKNKNNIWEKSEMNQNHCCFKEKKY